MRTKTKEECGLKQLTPSRDPLSYVIYSPFGLGLR